MKNSFVTQNLHFGMPTLIELNSIKENVQLCHELGMQFVELNMNIPSCISLGLKNSDKEVKQFIQELKNLKEEFDIYFTIHLDENFNFADFNSLVSNSYLQTLESVIKNATELECPIINLHLNHGVYFTLPEKKIFLFEKYNDYYMNQVLLLIEKTNLWNDITKNNFSKLCIENTDGWKDFEKNAIQKMLENKNFGLTFDIGHSESIGNLDEKFIIKNKDKLFHFHIHDATLPDSKNKSFGKNHLELGTGKINLIERLNLAKECKGRCVIETKTVGSLKNSVEWLKKNKYFDNE